MVAKCVMGLFVYRMFLPFQIGIVGFVMSHFPFIVSSSQIEMQVGVVPPATAPGPLVEARPDPLSLLVPLEQQIAGLDPEGSIRWFPERAFDFFEDYHGGGGGASGGPVVDTVVVEQDPGHVGGTVWDAECILAHHVIEYALRKVPILHPGGSSSSSSSSSSSAATAATEDTSLPPPPSQQQQQQQQ